MSAYSGSTPSILVKCNWASNIPGKNIKDTVKICLVGEDTEKENEEEELSDFLDIRNTVNFIKPNEVDVPTISLKPEDPNYSIEKLVFYGDVRAVELFGNDDMYLSTVHGTSIQTSDEFNVYEYKISVKQQREISLKMVRLSNQNYFWIYAVLVKLKKNPEKTGTINYENVENLLKDLNISEAAKSCLNFMKANNAAPVVPNMSKLSEMFKPPSRSDNGEQASSASSVKDLKTYIDYKFQILTDLLIMREKHFADKLDLIMELVKAKKN